MLTSLFGELPSPKRPGREGEPGDAGFAATAILETVATEVNERGQMVDRHQSDLVVTGSPAQAMREHFASSRADLDTASRMITLLDPAGVWASAVVKALSDAGGQPVERLHLRDHTTLRTLAMIERTTLVRRQEDALKIFHADVRSPGPENAEIPVALMERSHLTTVIIGPMQPHAVDALLVSLRAAASLPTWRCPNLLFMLPPGAVWIANKVAAVTWPQPLAVHVLSEPMTSASAVWNAMLGMWNHVRSQPSWQPDEPAADAGALRVSRAALDPARARQALAGLMQVEGLSACAVVDLGTGVVIARELRPDTGVDLDPLASSCAQLLRAHGQSVRELGVAEQVDEVVVAAGLRQQVLRTITAHPELFLFALLERPKANLALARFRVADAERSMA